MNFALTIPTHGRFDHTYSLLQSILDQDLLPSVGVITDSLGCDKLKSICLNYNERFEGSIFFHYLSLPSTCFCTEAVFRGLSYLIDLRHDFDFFVILNNDVRLESSDTFSSLISRSKELSSIVAPLNISSHNSSVVYSGANRIFTKYFQQTSYILSW